MNLRKILVVLAAMGSGACSTPHIKSADSPDTLHASEQLSTARQLVAAKDWPTALKSLQTFIDDKHFAQVPPDMRYAALSLASKVAIYHGPPRLGYQYLSQVVAMPQAKYEDWLERLRTAAKLNIAADEVSAMTVLVQRWPERAQEIDSYAVREVFMQAQHASFAAEVQFAQALFDAHWKSKSGIEPSYVWLDLALHLVESKHAARAAEVVSHITDVYVLIAMRADKRFDELIAAYPADFDIAQAADRELQLFQRQVDDAPQSLELQSALIFVLLDKRRDEAALAVSDSVFADLRSTNYPEKLYQDYAEKHSWFLNLRSIALQRIGRWDEALDVMLSASLVPEGFAGNVDQVINLAQLYCSLSRPRDAVSTLDKLTAKTSPFGTMQKENVLLEAALQMGDSKQVARSLEYLKVHRADSPDAYANALITVNQMDGAARDLIARLLDPRQRLDALLSVQQFAPVAETNIDMAWDARRRTLLERPDVQAAVHKVGRIESYPLADQTS